jgi:hypothetical protein
VDAERAGRHRNLPMLIAAAQLGRYRLSINDNLPSSRCGSQSGRFQSHAD